VAESIGIRWRIASEYALTAEVLKMIKKVQTLIDDGGFSKDERKMLVLVFDFFCSRFIEGGYGIFRHDDDACRLAKGMTAPALKKFRTHLIVPAAFFLWLQNARLLPNTFIAPQGGVSIARFISLLAQYTVDSKRILACLDARTEFRIRNYCDPELRKAFGSQQQTWTAIGHVKNMKCIHRPR